MLCRSDPTAGHLSRAFCHDICQPNRWTTAAERTSGRSGQANSSVTTFWRLDWIYYAPEHCEIRCEQYRRIMDEEMMIVPTIEDVRAKLASETGLAEVVTLRRSGRPLVSVVNVGIVAHPATGADCVAFVSRGDAARIGHRERDPSITVAVRRGWQWVAVDGNVELAGPDHDHPAVADVPQLLRDVFVAAGGTHDNWDDYDRAMAEDRRCAVLITPTRIYGNS